MPSSFHRLPCPRQTLAPVGRGCLMIAAIAGALASQGAFAGAINPITWESAQNISGDSDVRTDGSLVVAFNVGDPGVSGTTVNTVPFAPFSFPGTLTDQTSATISNVFFHETANSYALSSSNDAGFAAAPFSNLSPEYQALLSSFGSSEYFNTLQVSIGGLTPGQDYLLQVWSSISNTNAGVSTRVSGEYDSGNFVDLLTNTTNANGGLGQYVVGTFTADTATLVLELNGVSNPYISAFQVRVVSVPEPSSLALAGIGAALAGMAVWRRRFARWTAR